MTELYSNRKSDPELFEFLDNQFKIKPSKLDYHKKLVQLKISKIITTNWDNLIEETFKEEGIDSQVLVEKTDMSIFDERRTVIFKMHGDFAHNGLTSLIQKLDAKDWTSLLPVS